MNGHETITRSLEDSLLYRKRSFDSLSESKRDPEVQQIIGEEITALRLALTALYAGGAS